MKFTNQHEDETKIKYEKINPLYQTPVKILKIHHEATEEYTYIPQHWHRSLEIIIPFQGGSEIVVQGKILAIHPNDFLIINSRDIHSCRRLEPNCQYDGYAIQIMYDFLKFCYKDIDNVYFTEITDEYLHQQISKTIYRMIDEYEKNGEFNNLCLWSDCYLLMYQLLTHLKTPRSTNYLMYSNKQNDRLMEVLNYMEENYMQDFDAKMVANHFHISYGHLANLFKTYMNMTMHECMQVIRIQKAVNDLIYTKYSITKIAYDNGFANIKSFYREFKKVFNQTPNQYRKSRNQHIDSNQK